MINKNQKIIKKIYEKIKKTANQPNFFKDGIPSFHKGNEIGILLLPGFDNTSHIMREYEEYLVKKGYTVYNTTLPGRGLTVEEFGKTSWQDWTSYAMEDYRLLKQITKKVFIAGFSTGATVALYILENLKKSELTEGLILLSPALIFVSPVFTLSFQKYIINIFKKINPYPKKPNNRKAVFKDIEALKKYDIVDRGASNAILELFKLVEVVKKDIAKIMVPTLIIQSDKDVVISPYGAKWLVKNISSPNKKLLKLKKSGHPIIVDIEKNTVFNESYLFINSIAPM